VALSNTTAFDLQIDQICEEAYERVGVSMVEGYQLASARRSLNLMLADWANRGVNLWTVDEASVALLASTQDYTLASDTVGVLEAVLREGSGTTQTDIHLERVSVSQWASQPNKNTEGRPVQIYVDRQRAAPVATVWPIPDNNNYTLVYWRLRRLQDGGAASNNVDIPFRFLPALVSGLAYHLSMKVPGGHQLTPALKVIYDEAFELAAGEDRDRSSFRVTPRMAAW
jgi:hypothetical protein